MASIRPTSARPRRRVERRQSWRAAALGVGVLTALIVGVWAAGGSGAKAGARQAAGAHPRRTGGASQPRPQPAAPVGRLDESLPAAMAGLFPWQLQAPISREAILPEGPTGTLVLVGGLMATGASATGAYRLDTSTGQLSSIGNLASPTHDAAAVVLGGTGLVFGGGGTEPSAIAQGMSAGGVLSHLAPLPQPRADAAGVVDGHVAYIVGGYSGLGLEAHVLATTAGHRYRWVATLPVPVRYPAVASVDGLIYVFGGLSATGSPVRAIQVVDPVKGTAHVVGELPFGLAGASAGDLNGIIYIAGGAATTAAQAAAQPVNDVFAFDTATHTVLRAGSLPVAVAYAGTAVSGNRLYLVGGEGTGAAPISSVQFVRPDRSFGTAGSPGAGSPYYGDKLLVADRGNDRLLVLNDTGQVIWKYPSSKAPPPPTGFYYPDDAFFIRHGTAIISNQEANDTIVEVAYPSGRVLWDYGHPRTPGTAPGYLHNPDDAYLLRNGDVTVADPMNCRVLIIDPATKTVLHQIGTNGVCTHNPPHDLGSPNGDTPLTDGNLLISEIDGSWVDEYTPAGKLVWTVHLPITYPSDPQQIGPDRYLVADYRYPGAIVEFNRAGQVLYRYQPRTGTGQLNDPSLVELLPSGVFMLNDDHNDRMVAIDPSTGAIVWQYGHTGVPGTAPGYLNRPDGFDILGPGGSTPTHPATG